MRIFAPNSLPEDARDQALDWLAEVRAGGDPSRTKKEAREAPTVSKVCDRYIKEYAKPHKKPLSVVILSRPAP